MAALHLVTGYRGSAHITSADQGAFNAGFVGVGEYALAVGKQFEAQVVTNNTVRVYDGCLVMNGRHVNLDRGSFVDVSISNGTQSANRNDLIVARYTKNQSTGIESVNLVVLSGTPSSGTASDPSYNTGSILDGQSIHDMPLYRVKVSGLTISGIEPMFTVLASLADIQGSFYRQNMLINGDFQCNQRGLKTYEVTNTASYSVDMWRIFQVKMDVLAEGVKITGKSATAQGYLTQFIQLGELKTTPYTISAMVDGVICTFTVTPGATAKEKTFGKFKISVLTTSTWDDALNGYNNKLKVNICPVGTNTITINYVDVFEGNVVHPHMKEDRATALMRCRQYIQGGAVVCPALYVFTENSTYAYRFAICYEHMASTPTLEKCDWLYYSASGTSIEGSAVNDDVTHTFSNGVQLKTAYKDQMHAQCNGIRAVYVISCEPLPNGD